MVFETQVRRVVVENFDPTEFGKEYLTLDIGDLLVPLNEEDSGWVYGRLLSHDGSPVATGWYPSAYGPE